MQYRLSKDAQKDIIQIIRDTAMTWGAEQAWTYSKLIEEGVKLLAEDPYNVSSSDKSAFGKGVRAFHLEDVKGKKNSASHKIFYAVSKTELEGYNLRILRVLHEKMEPKYRIKHAMNSPKQDDDVRYRVTNTSLRM